jgi:hypothetical protein
MMRLAEDERFEEAAATRDRLAALARALERRRTLAMWRGIRRVVVRCEGLRVDLRYGLVVFGEESLLPERAGHPANAFDDSSKDSSEQARRGREPSPTGTPPPKPTPREESSEESPRRREPSRNGTPALKPTPREESSEESLRREFSAEEVAEVLAVDRWIRRNAGRLEVLFVDGELASALPRITAGRAAADSSTA